MARAAGFSHQQRRAAVPAIQVTLMTRYEMTLGGRRVTVDDLAASVGWVRRRRAHAGHSCHITIALLFFRRRESLRCCCATAAYVARVMTTFPRSRFPFARRACVVCVFCGPQEVLSQEPFTEGVSGPFYQHRQSISNAVVQEDDATIFELAPRARACAVEVVY